MFKVPEVLKLVAGLEKLALDIATLRPKVSAPFRRASTLRLSESHTLKPSVEAL